MLLMVHFREVVRTIQGSQNVWHSDSLPLLGLLKKAASGVLAIFPCSRTKRTLRA